MRTYKDPAFIETIARSINEGKLFLFLGAGFSKLCGLPLWDELARKLLEKCACESINGFSYSQKCEVLSSISDSRELISIASNIMKDPEDKTKFFRTVSEALTNHEEIEPPSIKNQREFLYNFVNKTRATVFTTNSDEILDGLFEPNCVIYRSKDFSSFNLVTNKRQIIHIHGSIKDFGSLIYTTDGYLRRYAEKNFRLIVRDLFHGFSGRSTVLFLGYGLSELQLLDFLINNDGDGPDYASSQNRFAIEGFLSSQEETVQFVEQYYKVYGIDLLTYSRDKKDYVGLLDALAYILDNLEPVTSLTSELFNESVEIVCRPFSEESKKRLQNNVCVMDEKILESLFREAAGSICFEDWLPVFLENTNTKHLFSFPVLQSRQENGAGNQEVPFLTLEAIAKSYERQKTSYLYKISEDFLTKVFEAFSNNRGLFNHTYFVGVVERWIFSDARLSTMPLAVGFVSDSTHFPSENGDWIMWSCFQTNPLLEVDESTFLKYFNLAIKSGSVDWQDDNSLETFLDAYSASASKYPQGVARICETFFDDKLKNKEDFFDESRDPFFLINSGKEDPLQKADYLVLRCFVQALNHLSDQFAKDYFRKWSVDQRSFYQNLSIYLCNSHFSSLREEFFQRKGSFLNDRKLFSEFYFFLKEKANELSENELRIVFSWIQDMEFENKNDPFTKKCQLMLLALLSTIDALYSPYGPSEIVHLINSIQNSLSQEPCRGDSPFYSPENISKDFFSSQTDDTEEEKTIERKFLFLDIPEFLQELSKTNGNAFENHLINQTALKFFEQKDVVDWIVKDNFQSFPTFPKDKYLLLLEFVFGGKCSLSLPDELTLVKRCLADSPKESRADILRFSLRRLFFRIRQSSNESDSLDLLWAFAMDYVDDSSLSWDYRTDFPWSQKAQDLYDVDAFPALCIIARTFQKKQKDPTLRLFERLLREPKRCSIVKAVIAAHLYRFWVVDQDWTRGIIDSVFDNVVGGHNYSFFGFSLYLFYPIDFVSFLREKGILSRLLNSDEFTLVNSIYGDCILRGSLNQTSGDKEMRTVLQSRCGLTALYSLIFDLLKATPDELEKKADRISKLFMISKEVKIKDGEHNGHLVVELLRFYPKSPCKEATIDLAMFFTQKINGVEAEDVGQAMKESGLENSSKMALVENMINSITDGYSFIDDIVGLFDLIDWTNNIQKKQSLINHLGKLNPTVFLKFTK